MIDMSGASVAGHHLYINDRLNGFKQLHNYFSRFICGVDVRSNVVSSTLDCLPVTYAVTVRYATFPILAKSSIQPRSFVDHLLLWSNAPVLW